MRPLFPILGLLLVLASSLLVITGGLTLTHRKPACEVREVEVMFSEGDTVWTEMQRMCV